MIGGLLDRIADLASPWGYLIVGVLTLLEASAMIGLVVPGEAALLVGGFLASQDRAELPLMMVAGAVGAIIGDSIGYEIGRHLGPSLRRSRVGRWVGEERWARAEDYLVRHGGRAVFFGRFVGVLRAMVPTIAGLSRMPYRTFLPWNALGGLVWAPGFVLLGYGAGGSYHQAAAWTGRASAVLLALVIVVAAVLMAGRAVARRESAVRMWARAQAERPAVARILARCERQLAYVVRRLRPNAAFGLSLTVGLVGVAVVGCAFGIVVQDVISRKDLAGVDGTVYTFFLEHRAPALTTVSRRVADLGGTATLSAITMALAALVWWRTRQARDLVVPLLAVSGSILLVEMVKVAVHRPPPPAAEMLVGASGFAFPSGQATRSAACLLTVAFVACRVLPTWRSKVAAVTAAVTVAMLIGLARLTLAVHWLTDVLGGWALGTLWFAVVVVVSQVAASLHHRHDDIDAPAAVTRRADSKWSKLTGMVLALAVVSSVLCLSLAGCSGDEAAGGGEPVVGRRLQVVTTTTHLADFARVLGGGRVDVFDLLKANVDPHDYEPTPADLEAVRRADLVVKNGVGLEGWLDRTLKSAGSRAEVVDASTGVALRDNDPHIWHDPVRAASMVATLARAMREADAEGAPAYSEAEQAYTAELDLLDEEIRSQIDGLPDKKLVTNHSAFGYYVERYGLDFVGSIIPSFDTQAELSSRELSALVARIKAQGVRAVFSEGSLPPKTAETVAREAGVRVVAGEDALYGDSLGPAGSDADTYLKMMRHNTRTIVEGLR